MSSSALQQCLVANRSALLSSSPAVALPQEPTHHQYDWDVAHALNFLRQYGLEKEFKLQVECNHATLAGHSCAHELEVARLAGALGGVDANTGDLLVVRASGGKGWCTRWPLSSKGSASAALFRLRGSVLPYGSRCMRASLSQSLVWRCPAQGWDTDEFLTNPVDVRAALILHRYPVTQLPGVLPTTPSAAALTARPAVATTPSLACSPRATPQTIRIGLIILRSGGLPGGLNFDAKLRRESVSVEDLVVAHISGAATERDPTAPPVMGCSYAQQHCCRRSGSSAHAWPRLVSVLS